MRGLKTLLLIALAGGCWWAPAWAQPVVTMGAAPAPGNGFFIYHSTGGGFPPMPPMIIPPLLAGMKAAAPHLSIGGTLTLPNNALLSAQYEALRLPAARSASLRFLRSAVSQILFS